MSEIVVPSPDRAYLGPTPPEVIARIIDAIQGSDAVGNAFVHYGLLPELPDNRERVYLLGTTDYVRAPVTRAHRVRNFDFSVRGLIEVHLVGGTGSDTAAARAWELLDAVDATLVEDPDLEIARYSQVLGVVGDEVVPMSDGWLARIVFTLGIESVR